LPGAPSRFDGRRMQPKLETNSVRIRRLVDPIEARDLLLRHVPSHRSVGLDHKLFDNSVRNVSFFADNVQGTALQVEGDLGFRKIKIDAPLRLTNRPKSVGELPHLLKIPEKTFVPFAQTRITMDQDAGHIGVGHPFVTPDDARVDFAFHLAALGIEQHLDRNGKPILSRIETADSVGKTLRKHRDHSIRKINARAPGTRLKIKRGTPRDVGAHIRNVDPEADLFPIFGCDGDGVVKITCLLSIDRDRLHRAHIAGAA
jgi:hypothetical protein